MPTWSWSSALARGTRAGILLLALVMASVLGAEPGTAAAWLPADQIQAHWLPVNADGTDTGLVVRVLRRTDGRLYVRRLDWQLLGLPAPEDGAVRYEDEIYYPVERLALPSLYLDLGTPRLWLRTAPARRVAADTRAAELPSAWFELTVNGGPTGETLLLLLGPHNQWLMSAEDLRRLQLRRPPGPAVDYFGDAFYALDGLPGAILRGDSRRQIMALQVAASAFEGNALGLYGRPRLPPTRSAPGGFINYRLTGQQTREPERDPETFTSAWAELGVFNGWGVGTSTFLRRTGGDGVDWLRLDTAWVHDRPERAQRLRLGDGYGRAGAWGRAVRYGGVQWGTDFSTQPGLITFPLPEVRGETALPATVDVYLDQTRRARTEVPAGPFALTEVPVVTGAGELQIVVRDALGREHTVSHDFYASPLLLRPGLHDYTYEVGALRHAYARESNTYGDWFAAATHRYGVSRWLTGELRAEVMAEQQTLGLSSAVQLRRAGIITLSAAASRATPDAEDPAAAVGHLLGAGYAYQHRRLRVALEGTQASAGFTQLGAPSQGVEQLTARTALGMSFGRTGSVSLSHLYRRPREGEALEFATAAYSTRLRGIGSLRVSVLHPLQGDAPATYTAAFVRPLGGGHSGSASWSARGEHRHQRLQLQRSPPRGSGLGYRVMHAEYPDAAASSVTGMWRAPYAQGTVEAARYGEREGYRATLDGSAVFIGGRPHLARSLSDGVVLARVPGVPGVGIYHDNQLVARTNRRGDALVPNVRAYERNRIRVAEDDLPLEAKVGELEREIAPYARGGAVLAFDIGVTRAALLRLERVDGSEVPAGATVRLADGPAPGGERFPVGYRGEAYVTGLRGERHRLIVEWPGRRCTVEATIAPSDDPLPRVGPLVCPEERT